MFLEKLILENFRQFEYKEFDFDKITLISGPTDKGKSTIFKAIRLLYTNKSDQTLDELINWKKEKFCIQGVFRHKNQRFTYSIERTRGGATVRQVSYEGLTYHNSEALDFLSKLINPVYTDYSSVLSQKDNSFFSETESKRRERFKKLFEINSIDDTLERIEAEVKETKEVRRQIEDEIKLLENTQYEFLEVPEVPDLSWIEKEFDLLNEGKNQYERYTQYLIEFREWEQANNEYNRSFVKYYDTLSRIEELEQKKKNLCIVRTSPPTETVDKYVQKKISISSTIDNLQKEIELVSQGKCHVCGQNYHGDKVELKNRFLQLSKEVIDINNKLSFVQEAWKEYEQKKKDNQRIIEHLQAIDDQIAFYQKELKQNESPALPVEPLKIVYTGNYDEDRFQHLQKQIIVHEQLLENKRTIEEFNEKQRGNIQERDRKVSELLFERDRIEHRISIKSEAKKILETKITPYIMSRGIDYIEQRMNDFFQSNAPEYTIRINDNLGIDYTLNGETWASLRSFAGFRQELTNFAFMYAIRQIENPGLFLIDEGESSADSESSQSLFDTLAQDKELEQIIAITHNLETVSSLRREYNAKVIELC